LKEETGLTATKIIRKVTEFGWSEISKSTGRQIHWRKHVFEMEVESLNDLKLDPIEHQNHLWATEDEVKQDNVGGVELSYM
jgi:8-oxo-dGTP pyrophosphatase MutT (NUDIX family)